MSPETVRLLTSHDAVIGYLVGVVGLLLVGIVAAIRPKPVPIGGIVITVAGVAAFNRIYEAPVELILGVALLAAAGLLPVRSVVGIMALSLPGAATLGYSFVDFDSPELIVFVVAGATLLGALVSRFDEIHRDGTGTTLMVIAFGAVMVLVPDTDWVVIAFAASLPLILAGYPLQWARLGRAGALGATGLLLWMGASGGAARPETALVAAGVLGVLIADPVAHLLNHRISTNVDQSTPWLRIGVQLAVGLVLGLVVRATGQIIAITVAIVATLGATGWWASTND